jgi:transcriptional regulator with XRE-family HTH domain
MGSRDGAHARGIRRGERLLRAFAEEVVEVRLAAGLTQADVARTAGLTRQTYGRLEQGRRPTTSIREAARIAAALGHELSVRMYPAGDPIRDAGQQRRIAMLVAAARPPLRVRTEVPLPRRDDRQELRAWDLELRLDESRMVVEVEMRLRDIQALERRIALKRRDDPAGGFLLAIADTRRNKHVLVTHPESWPDLSRLRRHAVVRALERGGMPPSGLVLL